MATILGNIKKLCSSCCSAIKKEKSQLQQQDPKVEQKSEKQAQTAEKAGAD